jgi:hypothetical protein
MRLAQTTHSSRETSPPAGQSLVESSAPVAVDSLLGARGVLAQSEEDELFLEAWLDPNLLPS